MWYLTLKLFFIFLFLVDCSCDGPCMRSFHVHKDAQGAEDVSCSTLGFSKSKLEVWNHLITFACLLWITSSLDWKHWQSVCFIEDGQVLLSKLWSKRTSMLCMWRTWVFRWDSWCCARGIFLYVFLQWSDQMLPFEVPIHRFIYLQKINNTAPFPMCTITSQ